MCCDYYLQSNLLKVEYNHRTKELRDSYLFLLVWTQVCYLSPLFFLSEVWNDWNHKLCFSNKWIVLIKMWVFFAIIVFRLQNLMEILGKHCSLKWDELERWLWRALIAFSKDIGSTWSSQLFQITGLGNPVTSPGLHGHCTHSVQKQAIHVYTHTNSKQVRWSFVLTFILCT